MKTCRTFAAAIAVLSTIACGYENPTQPTPPIVQPTAGVPSRIELSANPGIGTDAGSGLITARVFDGLSTALPNQTVSFRVSAGTLSADQVVTDEKGFARATIAASPDTVVEIVAAASGIESKTKIAIQALPPVAPPPSIAPPPPPPTPAPTPPAPPVQTPGYTVTVVAAPSSIVVGGSSTLTATVVATNGATAPTGYEWDCEGDGTFDAAIAANSKVCTYSASGTIHSGVRVTGSATATDTVDVIVAAAAPLFVSIGAPTPSPVLVNVDSSYTATVTSSAALPATLQWEWDHDGDGIPEAFDTGASPKTHTFSYGSVGVKTLKVTVRDTATGRTTSTSRTVTVQ